MKAWMRLLKITLTSEAMCKQITLGDRDDNKLAINISGYKYLSTLKDNFSIEVNNLSYSEITYLLAGKFNLCKIEVGYKDLGYHTIFDGGILYISNKMNSDRTSNTAYIICASKLIAQYNNKKLNLSLRSGINMYAALKFICEQAGVNNAKISEEFKSKVINETLNTSSNLSTIIDNITSESDSYFGTSDSSEGGSILTIGDSYRENERVIQLNEDNILLVNGYPKLSTNGLTITTLPTFNFIPSDVIVIDNSLLDISLTSYDEVKSTPNIGAYLDSDSKYFVTQVSYELSNTNGNFTCELLCRARSMVSSITGGNS